MLEASELGIFKKIIASDDVYENTQSIRRLYLDEKCKEIYGFTEEEFRFLNGLFYLNEYSFVPQYKYGFNTIKGIILDPFCIALFDVYYGYKITLNKIEFTSKYGEEPILARLELVKSIVKKYSQTEYDKMF